MTFDDMDDVALAAEYYMFSSQVDGEQDLLETPPKNSTAVNNIIVNGVSGHSRQNGTVESIVKQEPTVTGVGNNISNGVDNNSILARHLSIVTVKPPPLIPNDANTIQTPVFTYATRHCPWKDEPAKVRLHYLLLPLLPPPGVTKVQSQSLFKQIFTLRLQ